MRSAGPARDCLYRIKQLDKANRTVTFQMKNYKKGGQKELLKHSTHEFVRRFALHVLPKGFTRIRHYAILSSSWKKVKLPALQEMLATVSLKLKEEKPPLLKGKCPICKKGKLVTVGNFGSICATNIGSICATFGRERFL